MIGWAIETLVATTLLLAAVLVLRTPVRRTFGSGVAYALWVLPAARLALPPLPGDWQLSRLLAPLATRLAASPGIVAGVLDPATLPPDVLRQATLATAALGDHRVAAALVPPTTAAGGPTIATLVLAAWLAGGALFLGYHLIAHASFCRRLLRRAVGEPCRIDGVRVIESAAAATPLAFGVVRRYVAFPADFAHRYDTDERALALCHELAHHRHGDLIANWVALGMLALHWFNPVAWRAFRAFRADQEMANDARVLAGRSAIERHAYACAIVKAAHPGFGAGAAICRLNSVKDLRGRLKMLTTGRRSRTRLALGAAAIAGLTVAGLGLTASGSVAANMVSRPRPAFSTSARFAGAQSDAPAVGGQRRVVVVENGRRSDYVGADADAYVAAHPAPVPPTPPEPLAAVTPQAPPMPTMPPMPPLDAVAMARNVPQVVSMPCPGSATIKPPVIETRDGAKRRIVVCTNRIERLASDAAARAGNAKDMERTAYAQALAGLLDARTKMVTDVGTSDADRARTLAAIDQSIAEMRSQLARMN